MKRRGRTGKSVAGMRRSWRSETVVMGGNVRGEDGRTTNRVWKARGLAALANVGGCDGVLAGVIVGSSGNTPSYTRSPSV